MTALRHKRGDTLSLGLTWAEDGETIDLTGYAIVAELRTSNDELICSLTIAPADQTTARGQFTATATAEVTALWPIARLDCDVQFVAPDGSVASSETFGIQVVRDVTR